MRKDLFGYDRPTLNVLMDGVPMTDGYNCTMSGVLYNNSSRNSSNDGSVV